MAFTFDAKVESNATSTGLTVSHTCTGASLLVVLVAIRDASTVTGITYAGAALTKAVARTDATDPESCEIWYKVSPASGANNVVISLSASIEHWVTVASFASGATPSLDVVASASDGTGGTANAACSVSGATGLLGVDIASTENNVSPPWSSAGGDQTVLHNTGSASYGRGSSYEIGVASNETFNWTSGGAAQTWVQCVAIFTEGGAAAAPSFLFKPLLPRLTLYRDQRWPFAFPAPIPAPPPDGITYQPTGSLVAGTIASGADVFEASETGALTTRALASGADVSEHAETGSLAAQTFPSGGDSFQPAETGSLVAGTLLSGADASTFSETGTVPVGTLLSGVSLYVPAGATVYAKTGSLLSGTLLAGADVFEASETGSLTTRALTSGADVFEHNETGSLITRALSSGADVYTAVESGTLSAGGLVSGGRVRTANRTGSLTVGTRPSGVSLYVPFDTGAFLLPFSSRQAGVTDQAESGRAGSRSTQPDLTSTVRGRMGRA